MESDLRAGYGAWALRLREELDSLEDEDPQWGLLIVEYLAQTGGAAAYISNGGGSYAAENLGILWSRLQSRLRWSKRESYREWYNLWQRRYVRTSYPGDAASLQMSLAGALFGADPNGSQSDASTVQLWGMSSASSLSGDHDYELVSRARVRQEPALQHD